MDIGKKNTNFGRLPTDFWLLFADGDVLVACSAGLPDAPVTCHQVSLRQTLSELAAEVQQLPSVYPDCGAQADSGMQAVACLRYLHQEDASQLLVGAAGDGGGVLELWQLGEVPVSFGQIFKRSSVAPRVQVRGWVKQGRGVVQMGRAAYSVY